LYYLRYILSILICLTVGGCTNSHIVKRGDELSVKNKAVLTTHSKQSLKVYNVLTHGDSLIAFDMNNNNPVIFHKGEIDNVLVKSWSKGALLGGAIGATLGGGTAILMFSNHDYLFPLAIVFSSAGGAVGAIPGAISTVQDSYQFDTSFKTSTEPDSSTTESNGIIVEQLTAGELPKKHSQNLSLTQRANSTFIKGSDKPLNQIAGSIWLGGSTAPVEVLFGYSARRYINAHLIDSINLSPTLNPYLKYAYKCIQGNTNGDDELTWQSEFHLLSLGVEPYMIESLQNGATYYTELAIVGGNMHGTTYSEFYRRGGLGFGANMGVRVWSGILFAEFEYGYDTLNRHSIPCFLAGVRF